MDEYNLKFLRVYILSNIYQEFLNKTTNLNES